MVQCLGVPPTELAFIPSGPAGVRETLKRMASIVRQYRKHPVVRQLAVEVRQQARVPGKHYRGEALAVQRFVRGYVTYVRDVHNVETLQTPIVVLNNRAGDCDDQSMLVAALLEALGHSTRFHAMGFRSPDEFSHVLAETLIGDHWVAAETTLDRPLGWLPPHRVAKMIETV